MPMYVYHAQGHTLGFLSGNIIHDLSGEPLGRILGSHVYRLDGSYVGEWFKESVVDKPVYTRRPIAPMEAPPALPALPAGGSRRGVIDYGFPDVFHRLCDQAALDLNLYAQAAE